jgi:hypothetical protein
MEYLPLLVWKLTPVEASAGRQNLSLAATAPA